jgi:hypothetical protein
MSALVAGATRLLSWKAVRGAWSSLAPEVPESPVRPTVDLSKLGPTCEPETRICPAEMTCYDFVSPGAMHRE